ncbi:MAG TPA: twin-arginine translocase subunit TatC [candidate division Zixibacteria bacterium]|nr:twin-arginine translocase subunit TatC [candidate division Zixibacteria bacterium]MDD4918516.1 twin-arginine translocase subunit TatC [candidate division Zixibacteria bacterium]MDM7973386.1 twin-arginine translocase subunit TatC [candidate division Zixibacteria bacterium]HOD67367.1 twin-arginine translocase subunit TatC [candidate division Zixibacteria bacterium]HOZ07429.1 twin-arginine translocase subunit TatC [candidate division Zixibacteria bacterium]
MADQHGTAVPPGGEAGGEQCTPGKSMPFLEHLEELRRRLLKALLAVVVTTCAALYFSDHIVAFMQYPLKGVKLYNIEVAGTFYAYLKIALVTGLFAAMPVVFYQMWMFIAPGLYKRERAAILPLVTSSTLLFLLGAAFCFWAVLPVATTYLIGFAGDLVVNTITITSYVNYVGLMMIAFGLGFQLPILAFFLAKMGVVTAALLSRIRRYAIVAIAIVAAILTPPDVVSQALLGIPLYLLYEVSIVVVFFVQRGKRRKQAAEAAAMADRAPSGRAGD